MIGPLLEAPIVSPSSVFPDGTNVEFFEQTNPGFITMRVFERGVGETQSCGTGACAAALVAALEYPEITEWNVHVPGGTVTVTLSQDGHIALAGPAELVAHGTLLDGDVEGA
jgi:diaminopimelate epimerase